MALSFIVFPGVLSAKPVSFIKSEDWNILLPVGLFNIFDVIGRSIGGYGPAMIGKERHFWLHALALARVILISLAIAVQLDVFSGLQTV